LKDIAEIAVSKPKDSFCPEDFLGQLFLQERFKLVDIKGAIALKGDRYKSIIIQMIGMVMMVFMGMMGVIFMMIV
jgi:hypothetical protein